MTSHEISLTPDCLGNDCHFFVGQTALGRRDMVEDLCADTRWTTVLPNPLIECPVVNRLADLELITCPVPKNMQKGVF